MREARKVATAGCVKTQWEKATGLRGESITTERGREIRRRPMGVEFEFWLEFVERRS